MCEKGCRQERTNIMSRPLSEYWTKSACYLKWGLNSRPFISMELIHDLNTKIVCNSDTPCTVFKCVLFRYKMDYFGKSSKLKVFFTSRMLSLVLYILTSLCCCPVKRLAKIWIFAFFTCFLLYILTIMSPIVYLYFNHI